MRRVRRRLPVDTFPFLAVLLGIMGSLILVLLIMDRRAKRVARARAMEAVALAEQEEEHKEAARRAEWERQRQELHARLLQEKGLMLGQLRTITAQSQAAGDQAQRQQDQLANLQQQLQSERAALVRLEQDIHARRMQQAEKSRQVATARNDAVQLSASLAQLEQALADIHATRRRGQKTFSVIPYRGTRGDSRRPIYIECSASGLVFHPDRTTMVGPDLSGVEIRAEVERRIAARRSSPADKGTSEEDAYLLLLVRPTGIMSYYHVMDALRGVKVASGYELVDDDWVLDFPEGESAPASQPWMTASTVKPTAAGATTSSQGLGNGAAGTSPPRGVIFGAGTGGEPGGDRPRGVGQAGIPGGRLDGGVSPVGSGADRAGPEGARPLASPVPSANGQPGTGGRGGVAQTAEAGSQAGTATSAVDAGIRTSPSSSEPSPVPVIPQPSTPAVGSTGISQGAAGTAPENQPSGQPGSKEPGSSPDSASGPAPRHRSGEGTAPEPGGSNGDGGDKRGQPGTAESGGTKPSPRPVRMTGNRDWIIQVECTAGFVVLHPTRLRFPTTALTGARGKDNPLQQAIQQMVARRQTAVRPGEAPYRPQIRFLVRPDGLRAFHLAYPALEQLRLPMTRQDLERGEEITAP